MWRRRLEGEARTQSAVPASGPRAPPESQPGHGAHLSAPGERSVSGTAMRRHESRSRGRQERLLFFFILQLGFKSSSCKRAENVDHQPVVTRATSVSGIREQVQIHVLSVSRPSMWGSAGGGTLSLPGDRRSGYEVRRPQYCM